MFSIFDEAFQLRGDVEYYKDGVSRSVARFMYDQLSNTNFPTLYASTSPWDDFAESFASYVHVVVLKKPWKIQIKEFANPERTYGPCWTEERCAKKRAVIERALRHYVSGVILLRKPASVK